MKTTFHLLLALALIVTLGNAQEDALPVSTVYATQGNVATRQSRDEADMQAAVQAARQEKALKAAMAAYTQPRQVITTPEQFLAANPPRVPAAPNGEGDLSGFMVKKDDEVPEFEPVSGGAGSRGPLLSAVPIEAEPAGKAGIFDWLKPKKQSASPAPAPNTLEADPGSSPVERPKKGPFAALFKRGDVAPSPASGENSERPPGTEVSNGLATTTAETAVSGERVSAPAPPIDSGTDDTTTSIFVPRQPVVPSGGSARLKKASEANVGGVLVSIREGTQVGILSERGGMATIQLPDQRVGTIKSSTLAR